MCNQHSSKITNSEKFKLGIVHVCQTEMLLEVFIRIGPLSVYRDIQKDSNKSRLIGETSF